MTDTLYLLDTHGVAVWLGKKHKKEPRTDAAGSRCELTDAFREWMLEILGHLEPAFFVACLEGRRNWRKDESRGGSCDYKANRALDPLDPGLLAQLDAVPALLTELGVQCVRDETCEADDVIASLAVLHAPDRPVVIISGDKDLSQLIGENVTMFAPRPDKAGERHLYDEAGWTAKTGVPPHRMREYLALLGDKSDNVDGVTGWGGVTAVTAIAQTKSWPELVRKARAHQLEKIPTKKQDALIAQLEAFDLAYRLVGLRYDAIVPGLEALRYVHPAERGNSTEQGAAENVDESLFQAAAPDSEVF